jgi:tryptophan synthase beta chain
MMKQNKYLKSFPDANGHFGKFGGRYVAETLMAPLIELEEAYNKARKSRNFWKKVEDLNKNFTGRPSPLYFAKNLTEYLDGGKIFFKRDELNHTGAHKINHCIGQIILADMMGKSRIIAETGAGQHGVATATVCALFKKECVIYMGAKDAKRQQANVFRMKLLGAQVIEVDSGSQTLKDAMNEAIRDWVTNVDDTYYLIGTVAGPHPYPRIVRDFQSIIGIEARRQILEKEKRLPDALIASIGGGSNAIGLFSAFMLDKKVKKIAVEAAGKGLDTNFHSASLTKGSVGVLHGNKTYLLQDEQGQIKHTYSISAGLDYPGVGPEHAFLKDKELVSYESATDKEALDAVDLCAKQEGIIPALEPAHALAYAIKFVPKLKKERIVIVNICGRGDKDLETLKEHLLKT